MDHFFRSEDAHTEMRRVKKILKRGFLLELDLPALGLASPGIPDGAAGTLLCGCGCSTLRNYRPERFLFLFLGKSFKTKPFPRNMLNNKKDISRKKKKSFYMKDMPDSFNCSSVYAIFEESFFYRNKLEVSGQEKKLQPHPSSTSSHFERPHNSQLSGTGRALLLNTSMDSILPRSAHRLPPAQLQNLPELSLSHTRK